MVMSSSSCRVSSEAGRDPQSVAVTLFGAAEDAD
jgi:hypothetical protein